MADRLDWLNKHFVLLRHRTLQEAMEKEKYKLRPDLLQFVSGNMQSEEFLRTLQDAGKYKEACDFLAYTMHRRAAIWWGYRCLLSLNEELEENPAVERDIADIGAPKEMPVPDWAKMPTPEEEKAAADAEFAKTAEQLGKLKEKLDHAIAEARKKIPPEVQAAWDKAYGAANEEFRKRYGLSLEELIGKAAEKSAGPLFEIDPDSPIFQASEKLRSDIEAKRQETVELIKSVIPPKVSAHERKVRNDAMQAIYRWVIAPDEENSRKALDIGNSCPDQPAGLMALAAFWSFGNLTPEGKQVIATPPGLAANGICAALLQAALCKGGTRKYTERCKLYFELGLNVVWGGDNWEESMEKVKAPHMEPSVVRPVPVSSPDTQTYMKWKVTPPAMKEVNNEGE